LRLCVPRAMLRLRSFAEGGVVRIHMRMR
jgi:hypothetical protein